MFPCCSAKTKKHQPFELSYTAEEKPHLKLLLIGKTGSGKTTCLNMMINLASKSTYEDKRMITIT
jgi:type IV secretory pathway VirB4 component